MAAIGEFHATFPASLSSSRGSPLVSLNDDILDSTSASPHHSTLYNQDLVKLQSTHETRGYRTAISVSKDQFIQGYEFGRKMGLVAGWVRGVVVEKLLEREWVGEEWVWRWEVLSWDGEKRIQGEGGIEEVGLDLVVQGHSVLRKWVGRLTEVAGKLGLDIHGARRNEQRVGET
ncbi:hypothetical protein L211DRAFT_530699 [Terfezia boudieri ATCC MYA-4762]|uniref:Essential protein Yae1 N-terminal domain-containing protein n=1 Tax=Terfezia boudieri ATCC MYA-4762 TaxID=1051890 RepID=A0A3N4LHW3_9PEZI|nr:hypothetical protein L211DRAFT_530699 [Terfezia boudieri ATCC MYA-4762]